MSINAQEDVSFNLEELLQSGSFDVPGGAFLTLPFEGTITGVEVNITLTGSTGGVRANDFTILVAKSTVSGGQITFNEVFTQIGGDGDYVANERIYWEEGASSAPGTIINEIITFDTPIELPGMGSIPTRISLGNGLQAQNASGTWTGTVTLKGLRFLNTENHLSSQFSVFPNPANDLISFSNNENILVNGVEIVDLNGRTVKSIQLGGVANAQINISDLSSGMYLMNISSDQGSTTKKIVKN